ncbi:hypothetical protein [Azospirillum brasilense]|uniref:hypothetical protein n=1 Tax=Azospirillum brasilense TaxID=192 RepID=UPI0010C0C3AE|nr:hypothetical protein [Azospirillum brasilense]
MSERSLDTGIRTSVKNGATTWSHGFGLGRSRVVSDGGLRLAQPAISNADMALPRRTAAVMDVNCPGPWFPTALSSSPPIALIKGDRNEAATPVRRNRFHKKRNFNVYNGFINLLKK